MYKIVLFLQVIVVLLLSACEAEEVDEPFVIPKTTFIDSTYTETDQMIDEYVIVIKTGNVCDLWAEKSFSGIDHDYVLINKCMTLQGEPFLNIDGYAVDLQIYFKNVYIYSEDDKDTLEYIGISIKE